MPEQTNELRLSLRAAAALFVLPQACMVAALAAVILETRGGAAPHVRPNVAHAEAPPAHTPPATAITPEHLRAVVAEFLGQIAPTQAPKAPVSIKNFLDRLLEARETRAEPAADHAWTRPVLPEAREALAERLSGEIGGAFELLEGAEFPEGGHLADSGRIEEIRALIGDLQGLQASLAQLRGGGAGRGGASGAGDMLDATLNQIMPLLSAIQQLRDGGRARQDTDPALLDTLDRFLGRDEERPRRLAVLALLVWALDDETDA